jgi:hypothetical protein
MFKCVKQNAKEEELCSNTSKKVCVCKIPQPPKVELELGEETTTSHFSIPTDSTINELKFSCT